MCGFLTYFVGFRKKQDSSSKFKILSFHISYLLLLSFSETKRSSLLDNKRSAISITIVTTGLHT